jgi:hypothetical protein
MKQLFFARIYTAGEGGIFSLYRVSFLIPIIQFNVHEFELLK